jgi:hypothetical protein
MRSIFHYLFSLAAHLLSFGMGRRRSLSSIPMPRGKSIPIKPIPGWQMFIALWVLQKLWGKYGDRVTAKAKQQAAKYHGPGADAVQHFAGSDNNTNAQTVTVDPVVQHSEA